MAGQREAMVEIEGLDLLLGRLRSLIDETPRMLDGIVFRTVVRTMNAVVVGDRSKGANGTPLDTGFARASWVASLGSADWSGPSRPDRKGGVAPQPTDVEGALAGFTLGVPAFLVTNCVYMQRLEYDGWSQQAPDGFIRQALKAGEAYFREEMEAAGGSRGSAVGFRWDRSRSDLGQRRERAERYG